MYYPSAMRSFSSRVALLSLVVLSVSTWQPTAAHANNLVLESHAGPRDRSFGPLLAPLLEELTRRGAKYGYEEVGKIYEAQVSTPAVAGDLPEDFVARVEAGYRLWLEGSFREAKEALAPLVRQAHANPGLIVAESKLSGALFRALVALAMSHHRLGEDPDAWAAMAELLRSFETEVTRSQFGSEAYDLYQRTKKSAKERGQGALRVRSLDDTAAIIINERIAKMGEVERTDLLPGRYRVLAQRGKELGRVVTVEIKAGARAEIVLDPQLERVVVTSRQWTGLSFRDRAEREHHEVEAAARFASALGAVGVIVVGTELRNQRQVAYGALINAATGKEIRRASLVVDTLPPPQRLHSLARFLTGDEPAGEGIDVHQPGEPRGPALTAPAPPPARSTRGPRWGGWKWLATGGAVVGLGAGIGLVALDGSCSSDSPGGQVCRDVYETRTLGLAVGGAGLALGAVATWLWLTDHPTAAAAASALRLAPAAGGVVAGVALPL